MILTNKESDLFWSRVLKTKTCWIWTGYKINGGYGMKGLRSKMKLTHRISWEIHFGEIPKGLLVLHKCDVPACLNPKHLFLGTQSDNMIDSLKKGRHMTQKRRRFSRDEVIMIRHSKEKVTVLAKKFGVVYQTISGIRRNIIYKDIKE